MPDASASPTNATPPTTNASPGAGATVSSATPTATAPSGATPSAPAAAQDTGFRYQAGPGVPDWAVGKTAKEVVEVAAQLHAALQTGAPSPIAAPRQPVSSGYQASYAAPVGNPQSEQRVPTNDDFLADPYAATQRYVAHVRASEFDPAINSLTGTLASQARMIAEMNYRDEFRRWGPEIDLLAQQVPLSNRNADAYKMLVEVVRSRHVTELVNEQAEARLQQLVQTQQLRPQGSATGATTGATASNGVDFDKLPPNYARMLRNLGVTADMVDETLRSAYPELPLQKAREKWADLASKGDVITDGRTGFTYEGSSNG